MWLPSPLLTQSLVRGGHPIPLHQSAPFSRCGRTNFPTAAAWSIENIRQSLSVKASRDLGSKMSRASSRLDQRKGRQMFRCQMSRFPGVQVTDGCCSSNERGNLDPTTLGVWKATRVATLGWGWSHTGAPFRMQKRMRVHAVMDEKSAQIGDIWYNVGGRQALRGCCLGPISSGTPRRGRKSWGTTGDAWELGPRRYPFVLHQMPHLLTTSSLRACYTTQ